MSFKRRDLEGGECAEVNFGDSRKIVQRKEISKDVNKPNREAFLSLMEKVKKQGEKIEQGGLSIELTGEIEHSFYPRHYYRLDYKGQSYFVKKMNTFTLAGGGAQEVADMLEVRKDLSDLPDVEIVDYQLGYEDGDKRYLISTWNNALGHNIEESIRSSQLTDERKKEIWDVVTEVEKRLSRKYYDILDLKNIAYDPKKDKIIIFDLIKKPDWHVR